VQTKIILAIVIIAGATLVLAPGLIGSASARITAGHCENHNGDTIGSSCPGRSSDPGQGHTQTCNANPTDRCPPGQN